MTQSQNESFCEVLSEASAHMADLKGKTLFVTGASRGIGLAIALRAARDGANIVVAAKTVTANPKLPGTIYTAAEAIEAAGGKALPIELDIRAEEQVKAAVAITVRGHNAFTPIPSGANSSAIPSTHILIPYFAIV